MADIPSFGEPRTNLGYLILKGHSEGLLTKVDAANALAKVFPDVFRLREDSGDRKVKPT